MAGALEKARVHVGNEPMGARDSGFWSAGVDDFTVAEQDGCGGADRRSSSSVSLVGGRNSHRNGPVETMLVAENIRTNH